MNTDHLTPETTALLGSGLLIWVILLWIGIMTLIMPLYVWGCYNHLKRQTLLLRGIIDELRANRTAATRPGISPPR